MPEPAIRHDPFQLPTMFQEEAETPAVNGLMAKDIKARKSHKEEILADIASNKYSTSRDPKTDKLVNWCNIFVDDMLKKYWDIDLPKRGNFKTSEHGRYRTASGDFEGWAKNPTNAATQNRLFRTASDIPNSGVTKVSPMGGTKLSEEGTPVVVFGAGHATLAAPGLWPSLYRPSLANRGGDKRMIVGLHPKSSLNFFSLDVKKYKKFRGLIDKYGAESITKWDDPNYEKVRDELSGR